MLCSHTVLEKFIQYSFHICCRLLASILECSLWMLIYLLVSLSCRCLTQEDQGRHHFKSYSIVSICLKFFLLSVVIVLFCFWVEGMNLAHLTGEAAIQGTEVALGMSFILGLVNVFSAMS